MPFHNVRVNNYLKESYESRMDILSKIYIVSGWLIGVYRVPVIFKVTGFYKFVTIMYALLFSIGAIYYVLYVNSRRLTDFVILLNMSQYFLCVAVTALSYKNVRSFYEELFEFDKEIGTKFLLSSDAKSNFVQAVATYIFITLFNLLPRNIGIKIDVIPEMLPMDLNYMLEVYYYGHLFGLLNERLKSIRVLLILSFPTENQVTSYVEKESIDINDKNVANLLRKNLKVDVKKLMFSYYKIVKAYDFLNSAVKWQLLVILATSFVTILGMSYDASLNIINKEFMTIGLLRVCHKIITKKFWHMLLANKIFSPLMFTWRNALYTVGMTLIKVVPIVVPCKFGERVHCQVLLLRTALYSRTYNNVFDKPSRSIGSSFLALTEARSLSFSVFRMIEINISLPFKLLGLLASYVVILLQFQKVLNFNNEVL